MWKLKMFKRRSEPTGKTISQQYNKNDGHKDVKMCTSSHPLPRKMTRQFYVLVNYLHLFLREPDRQRDRQTAHLSGWKLLPRCLQVAALSLLLSGSYSSFQMFPLVLGLKQHLLQLHPLLFQLLQQRHLLLRLLL